MNNTKEQWIMQNGVPNEFYILDNKMGVVAVVRGEDNARKIVAAPDMYKALKYIIRELDKANIIKANSIFMAMPNKALAKADGK